MSRFQHLEFNDPAPRESRPEPALKDEAFYLDDARRAFESGRFDSGLRAYAKAIEHNPRNAASWTGQVRMLIELGEFREARLWADKALELFPSEPELLAATAVVLARSGDLEGALAFSDASMGERGETPYVWLARGDVLLARREPRAGFCFDKGLGLAGFDWIHLWLASRIYVFYRHFAKGLQLAQQALDRASSRAVVWFQLAECQLALGLVSAGQASLEQARELDPEGYAMRSPAWARDQEPGWMTRVRGWWRRRRGR